MVRWTHTARSILLPFLPFVWNSSKVLGKVMEVCKSLPPENTTFCVCHKWFHFYFIYFVAKTVTTSNNETCCLGLVPKAEKVIFERMYTWYSLRKLAFRFLSATHMMCRQWQLFRTRNASSRGCSSGNNQGVSSNARWDQLQFICRHIKMDSLQQLLICHVCEVCYPCFCIYCFVNMPHEEAALVISKLKFLAEG